MKKTVLIIEDNPYNSEIAQVALEKAGYNIILAKDGEEGIRMLDEDPDLVLLDLSLPKISGWDVVKKIREYEKYKDLPVIALTAHAMIGDREKALKTGCNSYLSKPCLPKDIVKEVRSFLENIS